MDSLESHFPVSGVCLFWGSKFSKIEEVEKCPHPREPLSGTPTAQIGGWEMIVLYGSLTLPRCSFDAHFKDKGDNLRPLTPMSVQNVKRVAKFG